MKKTMRSLQKGRSMLEVIAILAVMGILLIAGMVGFKILLDYLKHKVLMRLLLIMVIVIIL